MEFETFKDGTKGEKGKYVGHFDGVKKTTLSQASRQMAQDPASQSLEYESYEEERKALVDQKMALQVELAAYSRAAFTDEQSKVRRSGGDTHKKWLARRSQMEKERVVLVTKMQAVEVQLGRIRGRAWIERIDVAAELVSPDGFVNFGPAALEIMSLLREIRDSLQRLEQKQEEAS